jgi:hypothetical protein
VNSAGGRWFLLWSPVLPPPACASEIITPRQFHCTQLLSKLSELLQAEP